MARKTRAQIADEQLEQNRHDWKLLREAWTKRLFDVVLAACTHQHVFKVEQVDEDIDFTANVSYEDSLCFYGATVARELPEEMNWNFLYSLESVERAIAQHLENERKARELAEKRKAALNKLSQEEREILGLPKY